jgi:hypothetical protein
MPRGGPSFASLVGQGETCPQSAGDAMAIRIKSDARSGHAKLQFVLPDDVHDGPVSAVGSFNEWKPGAHRLVRRSNGTRSVTVEVATGQDVAFRYLGSGGVWFDDPDAHELSSGGGLLHV